MDYIENLRYEQLSLLFKGAAPEQEYLLIPSSLTGFHFISSTLVKYCYSNFAHGKHPVCLDKSA